MGVFNGVAESPNSIGLNWNFQSDINGIIQSIAITQFDPSGNSTVQNLPFSATTTVFNGLKPSTTYSYALNASWLDEFGNLQSEDLECQATTDASPPPPGPSAPTNVKASWNPGYSGATVSWIPGPNTQSFELKRFQVTGSSQTQDWDKTGVTSPFADTPDTVNTHQYEVIAHNTNGQSSALSNLLGPPPPPGAPTSVIASWNPGYTGVTVTWTAGANTQSFEIKRFSWHRISADPGF